VAKWLVEAQRRRGATCIMIIEALPLAGAFLLTPEPVQDPRGSFARVFSREFFQERGLVTEFPEWSISYNAKVGTLRGMHWQAKPYWETKLVQTVRGTIFDVIVDLREESPSFGRWHGVTLSAAGREVLYCPEGFAHGYQTLEEHSEVFYHISQPFEPDCARGLRWDDPAVGIVWPRCPERIVSPRDAEWAGLAAIFATRSVSV
jgi:dTDP-4-dehydrorhamnose 3,5-epimerase